MSKRNLHILIEACAKAMGFDKNQYLAVAHHDTKHQHVHIVANRIGFDGTVVKDSNNYKRMAQFCRQMEHELGLQPVLSPRMFLPPAERWQPRFDQRKVKLQSHLQLALQRATSLAQFEAIMKSYGYRVERGRGIAFTDTEGVRTKGSDVNCSLRTLEKMLGQSEPVKATQKRGETVPNENRQIQQNEILPAKKIEGQPDQKSGIEKLKKEEQNKVVSLGLTPNKQKKKWTPKR